MADKIEKITPEQEAKMPQYVEKWVKIGINTDRLDYDHTKAIIDDFRGLINKDVNVPLVLAENPIEAWVLCCLVKQDVPFENLKVEMVEVFNGNPKKWVIPKAFLPWQSGSFFVSTFSFYDFMIRELGVEIEEDILTKYNIWERTSELGCIYPLDNITIVCEKPTEIHMNEANVLHCDGGPALTYSGLGDFKIYSLNGVAVPEFLAVTPAEEIDLEEYNKLENADVKAEFVRKVGIERFMDRGKLLDSYKNYDKGSHQWWYKSEYEIYDMASMFEGLDLAPFLKMKNQTTDIFHMEGVSPDCKTVGDALKERFGGNDFFIGDIA